MPVLLIFLLVAVFAYAWFARRGSSLTRACRWRLDRGLGSQSHRCAACGAVMQSAVTPNQCLRR